MTYDPAHIAWAAAWDSIGYAVWAAMLTFALPSIGYLALTGDRQ